MSAAGDDSAAGTCLAPWRTIGKLNTAFSTLPNGATVLFRRGDTFQGGIVASKSGTSTAPLTLGAYGSGTNKPVITGFASVTAWTNRGNNLWESAAVVSSLNSLNLVTINGVNTAMGRTPNSGYWTILSATTTSISDATHLNSTTNWSGAEVVSRTARWHLDRARITSAGGATITFSGGMSYEPVANWGYFIQDDVRTLDAPNEWFFNRTSKTLSIYSATQPTQVQVATVDTLLTLANRSYITVENLSFQGANRNLVDATFANNLTLRNSDFHFSGLDGIDAYPNSPNFTVLNNSFSENNNIGINLASSSNSLIQGNATFNSGNLIGMGQSGDYSYTGILCFGDDSQIIGNTVRRAGYIGIRWDGQGHLITSGPNAGKSTLLIDSNIVDTTNFIKDDGGGIYTNPVQPQIPYTDYRMVSNNIVLNSVGNSEGVPPDSNNPGYVAGEGIYNDQETSYIKVLNNTVARASNGIFNNNVHHIDISGNVVFDATRALAFTKYMSRAVTNNTVNGNQFVVIRSNQYTMFLGNDFDGATNFFTGNNNVYARPPLDPTSNDKSIVAFADGLGGGYYSLAGWKTFSGQDAASTRSPVVTPVPTSNDIVFVYNDTSTAQTTTLNGNYVDMLNTRFMGIITLQPLRSAVLVKVP